MRFLALLGFLLLDAVLSQTDKRLVIEFVCDEPCQGPPNQQNDITWTLEEVYADGSSIELDSGSGVSNVLKTKTNLYVKDDACLRYTITDSWGDGTGEVYLYFGETSIDNGDETLWFENDAKSQLFVEQGKSGISASAIHLIQYGRGVVGLNCEFAGVPEPEEGCHQDTAVDVIFVLDASSDFAIECQHHYDDIIIDLVEHYLPRDDLKMAIITYGTDDSNFGNPYTPVIHRVFSNPKTGAAVAGDLKDVTFTDGGSWYSSLKLTVQRLRREDCIGGGHSTISAIDTAMDIITAEYGSLYDLTRQQYIILLTNSDIDIEETKNIYACAYSKQVLDTNGIKFVVLNEGSVNEHLQCLQQRAENIITMDNIAQMLASDLEYKLVQDVVCSPDINIAITEVFIDDTNSRWWIEILNLGVPFNISSLEFNGNLFLGSVDSDDTIYQGDIAVIGNMQVITGETPCDIYGGDTITDNTNYECSKYYAVDYDGSATLSSYWIGVNDRYGSVLSLSSSDGFVIESGYSYELQFPYSDFTNVSNWRESCYQYGSPGILNHPYCPQVCDPVKCKSYGDSTADCQNTGWPTVCYNVDGSTTNFIGTYTYCAYSNCTCGANYYFDRTDTRSCIDVPPIPTCNAYVYDAENNRMNVTWIVSPYQNVDTYTILYDTDSKSDLITPDDQNISITFPRRLIHPVRMIAVGTDVSDGSSVSSLETECGYTFAKTRRPTHVGETWDPTATPTLSPVTTAGPTVSPTPYPTFAGCGSSLQLDLLFLLDSSGSLWVSNSKPNSHDSHYVNWQAEIDFTAAIVNGSLPGDSRVGAISFSGCGPSYETWYDLCYNSGDLGGLLWGLTEFGSPNDADLLLARVQQIGHDDFIQQFTWTREALRMSLIEWNANPSDRAKMMIILTDGRPQPSGWDHEPCRSSDNYDSPELIELRALGVKILAVGIALQQAYIDEYFYCLVEDPATDFFEATDFDALGDFVDTIGSMVCSKNIEIMINEVGLKPDYGGPGQHLFFIELYNPGVGVSLEGFEFKGMINYVMTAENSGVYQGQYWVISTYNMSSIDQTAAGCRGCGQDLLISPDNADTSHDDTGWTLELTDALGNVIDSVERDPIYFPLVKDCYTHELIWEHYDNSVGGNWEESCYVYGTPQDPNQEPCPCTHSKCQSKGDQNAYCSPQFDDSGNKIGDECVCNPSYQLNAGVCVPLYSPACCFAWEHQCDKDIMLLTWCPPGSSYVLAYRIYQDGVELDTVASWITALNVSASCDSRLTPNFTITTIYQATPLIESIWTYCPPTPPTPAPTQKPTEDPTEPTKDPTSDPTTAAPTTLAPTRNPTTFVCDKLTIYVKDDVTNPYPSGVVDLRGTYTVASTSPDLKHWKWEKKDPTTANDVIEYVDTQNSWVVGSGFTYLVYPAPNDSSVAPPYSYTYSDDAWTTWTDTFTGRELQIMLLCGVELWETPHPTPSPVDEPPPPLPNCTHFIVDSNSNPVSAPALNSEYLYYDPLLHDGRPIWNNNKFEIAWYDRMKRWTFYDIANGKLYLAPVSFSTELYPLSNSDVWTSIEDSNEAYSLSISTTECNTTTPAPTTLVCSFPDGVIKHWNLAALDTWQKCYYTTYSDGTTSQILQDLCYSQIKDEFDNDIEDIYLFVGAINEADPDYAILGSYAHISVLETTTSSETRAEQTSLKFPQSTWWYYVENVAFGFSDIERINLAGGSCDYLDYDSDKKLCWHLLNAQEGGWRAGKLIDLNNRNDIYKVIYYKQCNVTIPLTICQTITVDDNAYYPELKVLTDYGVRNDYKLSWQQGNDYELGWMEVETAWLLDTVSVDTKTWLFKDPNYDPDFPPFDEELTWENRDDPNDKIVLTLRCGEVNNETLAPSPPPSSCPCIKITTDGLSAIEGYYEYSLDYNIDGGNYYRCDGTRLYYDTDLETWLVVGNGAYFELTGTWTPHSTDPTEIPPLGVDVRVQDRAQTATIHTAIIQFVCDYVTCPCETCKPYDLWEYVDGEIIYTSDIQMGFPIIPTENEDGSDHVSEFERHFDEFAFRGKHYDESVLQLSISDYILPGNTTLKGIFYPPETIEKVVYDSLEPYVYRDSNTVAIWFQLFDKYGSTYLDLSNVMVRGIAECAACTFATQTKFNETCDVSSIDEEGGFNWVKCELLIDESLFVVDATNTLSLYGELYISDALIDTSDIITLTLKERIEAEGILYPGIYGEFAMSPRYATDEVRLTLWLQSDKEYIFGTKDFRYRYAQAWWLSITFSQSLIRYIGFIPDERWGTIRSLHTVDVSNSAGEIEIWGSKIGQLLNTNGPDVPVGYFLFEVIEGSADGLYSNVLSFDTLSMSGDNGYSITNNVEGLMADIDGWSTPQASLRVIPDDPIEVYVEVDTNNLWNTAFLSGLGVSIEFPIFVAYHFEMRTASSLSCKGDNRLAWYPSASGTKCVASASRDQSLSGNSDMDITADDITTTQVIKVWLPLLASFEIVPWNTGTKSKQVDLAQVDMQYRAVGDMYYESLPLYVYCKFINADIRETDLVGVNEFIINSQFEVDDPAILEIDHYVYSKQRFLIRGLSAGSTTLRLTLSSVTPVREFATEQITVGTVAAMVDILNFGGVLVTHSEFEYPSHTIDNIDATAPFKQILTDLQLYLSNAGDIGSVHPFMKLSDGVLIDLTDDPNIEYTSSIPEYLRINDVDKSNGDNMDEAGAYAQVTNIAEQVPWSELVRWDWILSDMTDNGMIRSRGIGCIPGAINRTEPISVNVTLSCDTRVITRIEDPADYIWGIPIECYLIVMVYWTDGTVTDFSTDNRTVYEIITNNSLLILDENIVRANTSCDINTIFTPQNTDCYGFDTVGVSFENYPALANWTGSIEIEVVIFDRLRLVDYPAPYFVNGSYQTPTLLNLFDCPQQHQQSNLRIYGNLTNGQDKELTDRSDVLLNKTDSTNIILLQNSLRLVSGEIAGDSGVISTLAGTKESTERDDYSSNTVDYTVTDGIVTLDKLELYTFWDRDHVFEDLITTTELLKVDATFSDGVIVKDVLSEMLNNDYWSPATVSQVFTFSSTDPEVVSVDENGYVSILDNWWREVNITVESVCSDALAIEIIYPNLKPDLWDVDVEAPYTATGLQFKNQDINDDTEPFLWNIYINATNGTLLSFSVRLWWDDNLFIENGTDECSYFWDGSRDAWPQCKSAGDWEGQMVSWNIDTVRGELRLAGASSSGSSTNSSLQHVATCNLRVRGTEQNISNVIGQVIEITYMDDEDNVIKHVYNEPIVAGDGYQQINNGQTIKADFPYNIAERYETETSIVYECSALTNDEYIFSGDGSGCCDYALFGDVNLDCKQTAFDAQAISYYFVDTSAAYPSGFSTIPLGDLAWSQRIAMDQSLDYLQKDRNTCSEPSSDNPCTQGLEDVWYALQVSTGKFLYMNVTYREQTLVQDGKVVRAIAPMFIQEYSNVFRYATDLDATVFFELKNVTQANRNGYILNDSLAIGELVPVSEHGINGSIIIKGEYISDKGYWTFETNEYDWTEIDGCFEMAILYETFSEDDGIIHSYDGSEAERRISKDNDERLNCTQIDREYAFRGSLYYGDSFIEFTILCVRVVSNPPTMSPTPPPTSSPTTKEELEIIDCRYEDHGTAILAYFSQDTNRAGYEGEAFSCAAVWNPVSFNHIEGITEDSRCIWKDFRTMRIELGYEFTMRPTYAEQSYRLILVGSNIRDYAELYKPVRGYCIVYPMFNPPPVFASIIGPTNLGPCDDLRLLGSSTVGQAAPMYWKWTVGGNSLQNGCVLGSDAIPDDGEILFIPNNCLIMNKPDIYFYVFLNASNHYLWNFSYPASTALTDRTVIMYPQSDKLPSIQLLTPTVINITTVQDLIVPTFVSVDSGGSCNPDEVIYDLSEFTFSWSSLEFGELAESNPFGSAFTTAKNELDGDRNVNTENFEVFDLSSTELASPTLMIPGDKFEAGKYYGFKVSVKYSNGNTNEAYVGVVVNLPIPYPRPSIKYQSIRKGSDITLDINDFYDFYGVDASNYGIEWNCFYANSDESILLAVITETIAVINELNADLQINNTYNCSAHLFSKERNTFGITWGRQESYYVFEYITDDLVYIDPYKLISVRLTSNIGTINTNKRIVISATFEDYYPNKNTFDHGLEFDDYKYEWSNFGENTDLKDNVYGISVIDHIDYEHGYTVNFVVDDEVNRFIYDGEKYGFELKVTSPDLFQGAKYGGYGQFELIANRGPNGGQCVVELINDHSMLYRVECYGWTDEYMEIPLEYNFMLLDDCSIDSDCKDELICDTESSEYDIGVCVLTTVGAIQNYLREWTNGNTHYFLIKCDAIGQKDYILRSFIRDLSGFVTTFDTRFTISEDSNPDISDPDAVIDTFLDELKAADDKETLTGFAQYINAYDTLMDCKEGFDRTDVVDEIYSLYNKLAANKVNNLLDRHYDANKIFSTQMDELFYDHEQFDADALTEKTLSKPSLNVALRAFKIVHDMTLYFNQKRDGLDNKMIPRDLAVYQAAAMTWAGDAALEQKTLSTLEFERYFSGLKNLYKKYILEINDVGLNERLIDETHFNISYLGLLILSGWETPRKLFSDDSDCGGDLIDLAPDFEQAYFGGASVDYVKCELVSFNGGILNPTAISDYMSSPIIYWRLRGFTADGTEVNAGRRRLTEFGKCSPFLYTVPHNPDTSLLNYQTRRSMVDKQSYVPWAVCKSILDSSNETTTTTKSASSSYSDRQAPTAEDCYVLTHDEEKTVCACNSNYTLLAVEEELYVPHFIAELNRYNPAFTWTGLMESVGAVLWILILLFIFTFAFYILPSYDKHKALLAVKKGLPKSQREGAYFQTAEGKVYRAARINMNRMSFCEVYIEVYKIRLRNDHLCLWWCCDDPGSNISHFIKVLLTAFYCLLFMFQIAWFYGREYETTFADTLFAFLIAFETILPIWLCAWCISKIRPHEFTDEEIDELVEEQMPIITKDQKWEDEYESDIERGGDEEFEENDDVVGLFAVPEIMDNPMKERTANWDILRVYTDIDEEVEYLEENYMPDEGKWNKKKRKVYPLDKVGYVPLDDDDDEESSIDSYEERKGFEGQNNLSHWPQARDAASLGFIPVNEEEEYDAAASKMLHDNKKENIKQRRHEREGSISSKISSIFRRDQSKDSSKKKKPKKEKKRRRSSLMQLLFSGGSKKDVIQDEEKEKEKKYKKVSKKEEEEEDEYEEDEYEEDEYEDEYDDDEDEYEEESIYEDEEESETSSERRRRRKKEKKRQKKHAKKKKKPAQSSMNAPMQRDIELQQRPNDNAEIAQFIAVHLNASRKYNQFNKILQIARLNAKKISKNPKLLSRIVSNAVASGDKSLIDSDKLVRRASSLIKHRHPLFDEIESGATDKNQQRIQKLLRKQDVINTVFANIDDGNGAAKGKFAYSPAELRKLEELPERAPSQRPQHEKKTNIDDDVWNQSNLVYDQREIIGEDRGKRGAPNYRGIDMDDIWEVTGALPPELLSALEDPYDPWKENEIKPVQKPLREDEEEGYRDKLTNHFKKRRELLKRKYWLPRWCRYIVWLILLLLIILFLCLFLFEGNKLGATFLWIPQKFNNTECTISISEQHRFDYDFSLDESERRNPDCSPLQYQGSMPHCWDYRNRFTIASIITLITSVILVQPLYIAILALIAVTCLPICKPACIKIRNCCCGLNQDDPGYKHFLGGTILISGDTNLEYGQLADEELTMVHEDDDDDDDDRGQTNDTKRTPLLN